MKMVPITKGKYQKLCSVLAGLVGEANILFRDDPAWRDRKGGCFCLTDRRTGKPIFTPAQIGEVKLEKIRKYLEFSEEKGHRLMLHPMHFSSRQSRDPVREKWGGAVALGKTIIFSFSGFSEHGDEALMLVLMEIYYRRLPRISEIMEAIAVESGNPYWKRLRDAVWQKTLAA